MAIISLFKIDVMRFPGKDHFLLINMYILLAIIVWLSVWQQLKTFII